MNKRFLIAICLFIFVSAQSITVQSATAQTWELVWADEFDGDLLDPNKWSFQFGDGCPNLCGWGNNELQWYSGTNHSVGNGLLTITAKEESVSGKNYTSSRLRSINKGDWTYGRIEVRAKMPIGQGLWPAIWMLPTDPSIYGVWAASGEIDIMEYVGHKPDEVLGTIHFGGTWPQNQFTSKTYTLPSGSFNDDFHVFSIEWEKEEIRWYVDGELYSTLSNWSSTGGTFPAPFDIDFHLLINLAVGGNLPGNPDATTSFPQELVVDYVRVYEDISTGGETGNSFLFDDMEHGDPDNNNWFTFDGMGGGISANDSDVSPTDGASFSLNADYPSASGYIGGFGRTNRLNLANATHFNFWINPQAGQSYTLEVQLQDDDNGDDLIPTPSSVDDEFQFNCVISASGPCATAGNGWQLVSLPLADFFDDNSFHIGGNAILDPVPTDAGGNGQLVNIAVTVLGNGTPVNFTTDYWAFVDSTQVTSNERPTELPEGVRISPAYPNPFSQAATFDLVLEKAQQVKIQVFDLLGKRVQLLHDGFIPAQIKNTFEFEAEEWPNGVYLYQIEAESFAHTERVVLIK
ncbi:MAG: family 16 glycosylhydrolase [Rhodothermales bacterium]